MICLVEGFCVKILGKISTFNFCNKLQGTFFNDRENQKKAYNMWKFYEIQIKISAGKDSLKHSYACLIVLSIAAFTLQRQN